MVKQQICIGLVIRDRSFKQILSSPSALASFWLSQKGRWDCLHGAPKSSWRKSIDCILRGSASCKISYAEPKKECRRNVMTKQAESSSMKGHWRTYVNPQQILSKTLASWWVTHFLIEHQSIKRSGFKFVHNTHSTPDPSSFSSKALSFKLKNTETKPGDLGEHQRKTPLRCLQWCSAGFTSQQAKTYMVFPWNPSHIFLLLFFSASFGNKSLAQREIPQTLEWNLTPLFTAWLHPALVESQSSCCVKASPQHDTTVAVFDSKKALMNDGCSLKHEFTKSSLFFPFISL